MATDGNNRSPRYAIVAFNHVYDNGQGTSEGEGIAIANATATVFGRVNIVGNTVHSNGSGLTGGAAGIVVQNDEHVVVQSNYIYNNRLHGILVQDSSNTIKQCFIAGNVIENNNQVNNSEGSGIYITGDIERLKISNNQIVDNQGTPTQKWAGFFTSTALVTDLTIEDNDCQGHTNAANWSFDGSGAITRMRLSLDWRHQTTAGSASNTLPIPIPDNSAVKIRSHVVGVQSDGSNRAGYERVALVYRDGAGATIQGTVAAPFTEESAAGWDSTIVVSSNVFTPQVTGAAATTINWRGVLEAVSI